MARGLFGGLTEAEVQFLLAVSRFETSYGDGWKGAGAGSNNMGAVTARPDQPHFEATDTHADGKPFTSRFKTYPSKEAGLLDMALELLKPNVRAALRAGDGDAAVAAQKANGYFEAPLALYQSKVRDAHAKLLAGAGVVSALKFGAGAIGGLVLVILLAMALANSRGR